MINEDGTIKIEEFIQDLENPSFSAAQYTVVPNATMADLVPSNKDTVHLALALLEKAKDFTEQNELHKGMRRILNFLAETSIKKTPVLTALWRDLNSGGDRFAETVGGVVSSLNSSLNLKK